MERRIWIQSKAGSQNNLRLEAQPLSAPGADQVLIKIHAVGLNFADIFAILGLYSATPSGAFTPGLEFSGEILSTGESVIENHHLRPGDRVMGLTRFGAYADHIVADARYVRRIPSDWSYEQGAAFLAQGLTAQYAIAELGRVKKGETVLVQSAAGGVGMLSLFILEQMGARSIAVVGSQQKVDFLTSCGIRFEKAIVRRESSFASDLKAAAPQGIDVVLDAVYGPYFWPQFRALLPGGRYVLFGAADMMPPGSRPNYLKLAWKYLRRPRIDPLEMISDNRSVLAFNLIWLWDQAEKLGYLADGLMAFPWNSNPPHVGRSFPFEQALDALRYLQSGESVGKVVLRV